MRKPDAQHWADNSNGLYDLVRAGRPSHYRLDGIASSETQQNLFITRWLAKAKRPRRFPREVARDSDWLLKQGRTQGVRAKLPFKLNFLWQATTGTLEDQPGLYRLSHALDVAREYHWVYQILSDDQWQGRRQMALNPEVNGVYCLMGSASGLKKI